MKRPMLRVAGGEEKYWVLIDMVAGALTNSPKNSL